MTNVQVQTLVDVFRKRFGAEVEAQPVNDQGRYRFAVVSPQFQGMTHLQRQDALWAIVDQTVPREAALDISLILAFAPNELAATE